MPRSVSCQPPVSSHFLPNGASVHIIRPMLDLSEFPSARRFLDLVTRPLEANQEQCLAARNDLARRIEASPQTTEAVLEDAAKRLEAADQAIWWKKVMPLIGMVALVSLAVVVGTTAYRFIQFRGVMRMVSPLSDERGSPALDRLARKLPPDERLLLFGDTNAGNEADKWKPLWESDRSNPAFLQAYAEGCLSADKVIPADLLKQAEAIDPGNAFLPTLAAGALAGSAVERESRPWSARKSPEAPKFTIKDQARFEQAYEALRKASGLPGFTDHSSALNQERFRHLPPGRDYLERASVVAYAAGFITQKILFRNLTNLLAAKAATFDEAGDIVEFRECVRLWRWLAVHSADSGWSVIDGLITRAIIQMPLKNFRDAASRLGLEDTSKEFRMLDERLDAEKEQRKQRDKEDDTMLLLETKSSVMASLTLPMVRRQLNFPPVLAENDFMPGRLLDHALLGQAHATISAICFGLLMLGALLSRTVVPHSSQIIASRLACLVSPRERVLLFVAGILVPVGLYVALIQIPHLSAREWGMRISIFIVPSIQLATLTLLMINLTIGLGARLTRNRLMMLVEPRRSLRRCLPWIGAACSILAMLGCGSGFQLIYQYGIVLLIPAVCWPLAFWLPRIFRKPKEPNLRRVALHQVLAPVWTGAMIVSCLLFALNRSDEIKWTARDQLMAPDPEMRGMSHIEGVVAKQLGTEVLELLKALPQP